MSASNSCQDKEDQEGFGMKRFHAHVRVNDLERSVRFCSTLFGTQPALIKSDYAKSMLDFAFQQRVKEIDSATIPEK
jgi:hypothetical protein